MALALMACNRGPTISEASNYLEVKALQIQLDSYKTQLRSTKDKLTQVIPMLEENLDKPKPLINGLRDFLEQNDCVTRESRSELELCYKITRLNLIHTTSALEQTNNNYWASKQTVQQLIGNINAVVESIQ